MGGRTHKTVLLTHNLAAGVWLGPDAAMAVLVFTAVGTHDPGTRGFALRVLTLVPADPGLPWAPGDIGFPAIALPTALLTAYVLSVFKPWGRMRRSGRPSHEHRARAE